MLRVLVCGNHINDSSFPFRQRIAAGCTVPGSRGSEIDAMVTSAVLDTRVGPIFCFFPRKKKKKKKPNKQEQA